MTLTKFYTDKKGRKRPISERKGKRSYHGQTSEPSWKESSVQDVKGYPHRSKKTMTYHGRSGHPIIHKGEKGGEYIMVRQKGGGTKRLYLTPETRKKLESKEGLQKRG